MRKRRIKSILRFGLIFLLAFFCNANKSYALRVSPGAFCAQNVEVGQDTDTGIDLTIDNETDEEREFSIRVVEPSKLTSESLKGYSPLPDLSWLRLERTHLVVPAKGQGRTRLYINVPNEEKYFNQQWAVSCLVEYVGQKGLFQEAIQTLYMFETRPKEDVTQRPDGRIGVAPSVVKVSAERLKAKEKFSFKVYNNTPEERVYSIKSFVPEVKPEKLAINVTPGLVWAKRTSWVTPQVKKMKLPAGGVGEIKLNVKVPKSALEGEKGVESLIFIDSDRGERRFVRVQVE